MTRTSRAWRRRRQGEAPLVIGHRGASAHATENTVEAFRRAVEEGADGVELDVLLCATGEVVVFHDDDLQRLGGSPERIDALPLPALRDVRLSGGARIPTLEEAFEACGSALLVNVELKTRGLFDLAVPRLVDAVSRVVERIGGAAERIVVSSFNPRAIALWAARRPGVPAALLFEAAAPLPLRRAWALPLLRPFAVHPEHVLCTPHSVSRWHAAGHFVGTWTVDEPDRLRALSAAGVDAIIANDPAAARRALCA